MASFYFELLYNAENVEISETFYRDLKDHLDKCLSGVAYYLTEPLGNLKRGIISITLQSSEHDFADVKREVGNFFGMNCEFERLRPKDLDFA